MYARVFRGSRVAASAPTRENPTKPTAAPDAASGYGRTGTRGMPAREVREIWYVCMAGYRLYRLHTGM